MSLKRYRGRGGDFTYVHLMSRVVQPTYFGEHYPFDEDDKDYMVSLLSRLDGLFCLDVLAYCFMDNHFHVIIRIEKGAEKLIKPPEVKKRYEEFYSGKRQIDARTHKCHVLRSHLNDFSYWMWMFLRMSSFRHNNKFKRRGALWQDGFKSVVLEDAKALSTCLKYVELNPVRAKMVSNPMNYQWSSWGVMKFSGIHPYRQRIVDSLRQVYEIGAEQSDAEVFSTYSKELRALVNCQSVDEASLISLLSEKIYTCLLKANPKLTRYNRLRLSSRRRGNGLNGMAKRPLPLV